MPGAHEFLQTLAVVMCVAAATTVLFQRLHQPVVLGYLLAGAIIGPHVPVPLIADSEIVHTLSELGVILLMFSLGLEFSLRKLAQVGPTAGIVAVIQTSLMIWLGYVIAQAFGWSGRESLYTGALIAISSTTIILKAFEEFGIRGGFADLVFGVLVVEDLIAILLLAVLTTISTGESASIGTVFYAAGRLVAVLGTLVVVGLLVVPPLVRAVVRLGRAETTVVTAIGICFAVALIADAFGYSVALGAFLAGNLVAESGQEHDVETLVMPVRDVFAAVFFVSVGMLIDPRLIAEHLPAVLALTVAVVVGKVVSVGLGTFLAGQDVRTAVQAGMSLAQIGEFSFIIAGVGLATKATGDFLYPVAVAVSAITTLLAPLLIRASDSAARYVDRHLPERLETFVSLYGTWVERLRAPSNRTTAWAPVRRLLRWIMLDAAVLMLVAVVTGIFGDDVVARLRDLGASIRTARFIVVLATGLACLPFAVGIFRCARRLGYALGDVALPRGGQGALDLGDAPRGVLVVTLQLLTLLLVGAPLVAVTQPFLRGFGGAGFFALVIGFFTVALWRSMAGLHGHTRAVSQVIAEALVRRVQEGRSEQGDPLAEVRKLLPGLGEPVALRLDPGSPGIGRTLAQINLRGATGATVLAIVRDQSGVVAPEGDEMLRANDIVAITGTSAAVQAARHLLAKPEAAEAGR